MPACKKRNLAPLSAELLEIDKRRRAAITESESAQARRKALSQQIGIAKRKGEPADALMAEVAALEESQKNGEADGGRARRGADPPPRGLPNLPFDDVPDGTDETGNVEIRRGRQPAQLRLRAQGPRRAGRGDRRDGLRRRRQDLRRALRRAEGQLARLERAIAQFMLDLHTRRRAATPRSIRRCWCATTRPTASASCRSSPRTCSTPTTASG